MRLRSHSTLLLLTCLLTAGPDLSAQNLDLPYSSGSTGADGAFTVPATASPVDGCVMAYDSERQETVRFGGINASVTNSQTWIYRGNGWQLASSATSPSARAYSAMAFDDARNEIVLFGGMSGSSRMNDTWVWNGTVWAQRTPASSPPARAYSAMAWDESRQQIVLYGGRGDSLSLQDTWVWDGTNWTEKNPSTIPGPSVGHAMAPYPPQSAVAMAGGNYINIENANTSSGGLWLWNGSDWTFVGSVFPAFEKCSLVFDPSRQALLHFGGTRNTFNGVFRTTNSPQLTSWNHVSGAKLEPGHTERSGHAGVWEANRNQMLIHAGNERADTLAWTGSEWLGMTAPSYTFDLNSKPDAIWNFSTINVPVGTTVQFKKNAANNGVLWLASENVTINGTIDVSGGGGVWQESPGAFRQGGRGGPGGFDGGQCGPAQTGGGTGGGAPGADALHADAAGTGPYGTLFAQPVIGGSGGGGRDGSPVAGGSGGGGGGAVVIASSKDIFVNGSILAGGGSGGRINSEPGGGAGSGGLIKLVADRVLLGPDALVDAGDPNASGKGRLRIEGYVRQIPDPVTQLKGSKSLSVPVAGSVLSQAGGRLLFKKVHGNNVTNPPRGDEVNPDVIFSAAGPVQIEVEAINIPDGTPVTVQINHSLAGEINLPATGTVVLQQCKATFTATIPAGTGRMVAKATYNVGGPTGNGTP